VEPEERRRGGKTERKREYKRKERKKERKRVLNIAWGP
jgi:hypothetical protein